MEINFWAVLVCGVVSMILGFIWYGPLFGKKWMKLMGSENCSEADMKEAQKGMKVLYTLQFLISLFQIYVFAHYINAYVWPNSTAFCNALWIWAGFILPIIAGSVMWNGDNRKTAFSKFLIQGGYQLVLSIILVLILSNWK